MLEEIIDSEGNVVSTRKRSIVCLHDLSRLKNDLNRLKQKYAVYHPRLKKLIKNTIFTLTASSILLAPFALFGENHFRKIANQERPWLITEYQAKYGHIRLDDPSMRSLIPGLGYLYHPPILDNKNENISEQWGYKDRISLTKREDTKRIIIIGDSMSHGCGIDYSKVYPTRLEEILNESRKKGNFDVVNLGIPGYQTTQCYSTMKYIAIPYLNPDMIIYAFCINDVYNSSINDFINQRNNIVMCLEGKNRHEQINGLYASIYNSLLKTRLKFTLETNSTLYNIFKGRLEVLRYEHIFPAVRRLDHLLDETFFKQPFGDLVNMLPYFYPHISDCQDCETTYVAMQNIYSLSKKNNIPFMILEIPDYSNINKKGYYLDDYITMFNLKNPEISLYRPQEYIREVIKKRKLKPTDLHAK